MKPTVSVIKTLRSSSSKLRIRVSNVSNRREPIHEECELVKEFRIVDFPAEV